MPVTGAPNRCVEPTTLVSGSISAHSRSFAVVTGSGSSRRAAGVLAVRAGGTHRRRRRACPLQGVLGFCHLIDYLGFSRMTVTGPSFTSSTAIMAPNIPRLAPSRSQNRSYRGSATSGEAAAT